MLESMPVNPWADIGSDAPYVLPCDRPFVDAFNNDLLQPPGADSRLESSLPSSWINTALTPEPRLGPIDAQVILLQANASYDPTTSLEPADRRRELDSSRNEYAPHLGIESRNPWWSKTLASLLRANADHAALARKICSVEFFPYRSMSFAHAHLRLPSQQYTFGLVDRWVREGRLVLVLVMRAWSCWIGAVPALHQYYGRNVFLTRNRQRTFVSAGNLPAGVHDRLLSILRG